MGEIFVKKGGVAPKAHSIIKFISSGDSVDFANAAWTSFATDIDQLEMLEGDSGLEFTHLNGVVTVPVNGIYLVGLAVKMYCTSSTKNLIVGVGLNGTTLAFGGQVRRTGTSSVNETINSSLSLTAGDTLEPMGREYSGTGSGTAKLRTTQCEFFVVLLREL